VEEFIFPIDFVVLEAEVLMSPENKILIILDLLFLTTSNALINCRDEKINLIFENITMELNVFNLKKQPMGFYYIEHPTLNWVGDFLLGGVEFDHEEELISCVYESFYIEHRKQFDTFTFEEQ